MRQIKFRAWDKRYSKMLQWGEIIAGFIVSHDPVPGTLPFVAEFFGESSPFEMMQFTGLKDKNGREIYEGDIIKYESNTGARNAAVYWRHGSLSYLMRASLKEGEAGEIMEIPRTPTEREIVGNIYENPELLPTSLPRI